MGPVAKAIAERMEAVRERTLALFAPLDRERLHRSPDPIMSPPVWDLGHIAAYEELWLVERLTGRASLYPGLQAAYDAFETPRAVRGDVELLDADGALDYLARVRGRSLETLAAADLDPEGPELVAGGFVFELVLAHEAQHTETVLQSVQMMPSGAYRPPARREVPESVACPKARIEIAGGPFWMGSGPAGFAYDCERPRHRRSRWPRPFVASGASAAEIALHLSRAKALPVSGERPGRLVIGADQILCLDGRLFGKPAGRAAAIAQLEVFSSRTHELYSGCCVASENTLLFETVGVARLSCRRLSPAFIDAYVAQAGDLGSAGVYRIEGLGIHLFDSIEGDPAEDPAREDRADQPRAQEVAGNPAERKVQREEDDSEADHQEVAPAQCPHVNAPASPPPTRIAPG